MAPPFKFADLHAHPSGKNFPKHFNGKTADFLRPDAHLWDIPNSRWPAMLRGLRSTKYSQADIASLIHHGGKLVFASIYPFEEGFVKNLHPEKKDPSIGLLAMAMRYTRDRIKFLRSNQVDYFTELKAEWEFLQRKSGQAETATFVAKVSDAYNVFLRSTQVRGLYYVLAPQDDTAPQLTPPWGPRQLLPFKDLDKALNTNNCAVLVLTIEGMHALSMINGDAGPVEEDTLKARIDEIKTWPVFFMTFAHHFDNNLCAHAKSMFDPPLKWKPNQDKNMNKVELDQRMLLDGTKRAGFTELGFHAIQQLLSIRRLPDGRVEDNPAAGRRILIDTKHMSASARRNFYDLLIRPYNEAPGRQLAKDGQQPVGCIPVIASHSAYSGVDTLQELIAGYDQETDRLKDENRPFNYWNINLSGDDVQVTVQSGGLIGLNLDQRILGVMFPLKLHHLLLDGIVKHKLEVRHNNVRLIVDNLLHMAEAIKKRNLGLHRYDRGNYSIWNCLCLGTDFDGGIDPVADYSTAGDMERLRQDMQQDLERRFTEGLGPAFETASLTEFIPSPAHIGEVLDRFFWDNAVDFLKKHFHAGPPQA